MARGKVRFAMTVEARRRIGWGHVGQCAAAFMVQPGNVAASRSSSAGLNATLGSMSEGSTAFARSRTAAARSSFLPATKVI